MKAVPLKALFWDDMKLYGKKRKTSEGQDTSSYFKMHHRLSYDTLHVFAGYIFNPFGIIL